MVVLPVVVLLLDEPQSWWCSPSLYQCWGTYIYLPLAFISPSSHPKTTRKQLTWLEQDSSSICRAADNIPWEAAQWMGWKLGHVDWATITELSLCDLGRTQTFLLGRAWPATMAASLICLPNNFPQDWTSSPDFAIAVAHSAAVRM